MGFTITSNQSSAMTQVPDWFIRTYMPTANGNFVKTYLYLLMLYQHPDYEPENSVRCLADNMECTESDILCALRFWKKEQLLDYTEQDGTIVSIELKNVTETVPPEKTAEKEPETAERKDSAEVSFVTFANHKEAEIPIPNRQAYTPLQAEALMKDIEISQTISSVEQLLGTTVSATHLQLILYFMCDIGFSKELIITLYNTALKKGKSSPRYIEAIGISWAKQGIHTSAEAEQEASAFHGRYSLVAKALGIQRSLVPAECSIIDDWNKYHFADSIIEEACKRTVLQTGGTSLQYATTILDNWAKQNVISLSDIDECDKIYHQKKKEQHAGRRNGNTQNKNQFQNFPQRNYSEDDYNNLEKQLLRNVQA